MRFMGTAGGTAAAACVRCCACLACPSVPLLPGRSGCSNGRLQADAGQRAGQARTVRQQPTCVHPSYSSSTCVRQTVHVVLVVVYTIVYASNQHVLS